MNSDKALSIINRVGFHPDTELRYGAGLPADKAKSLYDIVRQRAQFRCEYCHYPELLSSAPLSIDHIQPQSLGGSDELGVCRT